MKSWLKPPKCLSQNILDLSQTAGSNSVTWEQMEGAQHFLSSSPAVVFLQPWVLYPLQKSVLTHALNELWLKYTIFNLPSDPTLKHKIPQIRENKIPRKSDLEIESPMYQPPHPNFFIEKRNFYQKKKKNQEAVLLKTSYLVVFFFLVEISLSKKEIGGGRLVHGRLYF